MLRNYGIYVTKQLLLPIASGKSSFYAFVLGMNELGDFASGESLLIPISCAVLLPCAR
jgi:hypothetical protein